MTILLLAIVITGTIIWFSRWLMLLNIPKGDIYLHENSKSYSHSELPFVSILVPAKNEEENISKCITSLFEQNYPNFEIIVIDDRSTDRTAQILKKLQQTGQQIQDKLKILNLSELPHGWTGKTHALYEGSKIAKGKWLLFTDADTIHNPLSLKSTISYCLERDVDFLSLYPQSRNDTFWEKITQPLGGAILHIWYPFEHVNNPKYKTAFANGQFILIKKECYLEIGGHEKVKSELLEDVAMAKLVKAHSKTIKMAYGFNIFSTRMYKNIPEIWKGWRRIFGVLAGKRKSLYPISLLLMILFSFIPFILLFNVSLLSKGGMWTTIYLLTILEIILLYLTNASIYVLSKNNPLWGIFYPVACIMMFCILLDAITRKIFKKPINWRGTTYTTN